MKLIKSLILSTLAMCALVGCTDDLFVASTYSLDIDESDIIETQLGVSISDFTVSVESTRADDDDHEVPSGDTEIMSDFEKTIDNIWVFQYDTDGNLLIKPRYYTATESETDGTWSVLLKPVASTIYVVTNVNNNTWASSADDFMTTTKLLASTLPTPYTIYDLSETATEGHIPMKGCVEGMTPVSGGEAIIVPVEHMYAKVKMRVVIDSHLTESDAVQVNYITYNNIPYYCQIGTLYDGTNASKNDSYPTERWVSRSFQEANNVDDPNNEGLTNAYDYVIYVPENIQGENTNTIEDKDAKATGENTPVHASMITVDIRYLDDDGATQEMTFSACPGGNEYNNYNIRRNQVYRVTLNVGYPTEVIRQPSANCIFGYAGETITFFPYYRVETGGGYDFSDYLSPNEQSGTGKKIGGLKIIWQTKDCIGDNSNGDLVYLVSTATEPNTHNGYEQIYVKTQKEGNALIGAYDDDPFENPNANIIWSWHIWVRDKQYSDPTNLANAMVYYTYEWDDERVYSYQYYTDTLKTTAVRVPGYQIMSCNIGALQDVPDDYEDWDKVTRTFGTLYQWGRKDPFPPVIKEQFDPGNYSDEITEIHYGNDNTTQVAKVATNTSALFHTHIPESGEGMAYTIQHPTVYMCGMTSIDGYSGNSEYSEKENYTMSGAWSEEDHDNKEWGGLEPDATGVMKHLNFGIYNTWDNPIEVYDNYGTEKSIFDPCPYGWRVPPADLWMGFLRNGINDYYDPRITTSRDVASLDNVNYDSERSSGYGMSMYLGSQWRSGEVSYFPCQGFRFGNGQVYRVGTCGCYANANVRLEDNLNCLHLHDFVTYTKAIEASAAYTVKCSAGSIRCVRDTK